MIPQELIEKALALTGKTMEDMNWIIWYSEWTEEFMYEFSYHKFYAYLLSPEFIGKYYKLTFPFWLNFYLAELFLAAIYQNQDWNSEEIIRLLSKI